jgi:hypothetical protein
METKAEKKKVVQVHAPMPAEIHRRLRIMLAEDGHSFSYWLHVHVTEDLARRRFLTTPEDDKLVTDYLKMHRKSDNLIQEPIPLAFLTMRSRQKRGKKAKEA